MITTLTISSTKPYQPRISHESEHERYPTEIYAKKPVVAMNYPKAIRAFYMRLNDDGQPLSMVTEYSRNAGRPGSTTSSAQHFFDRSDPAGRGGIISGIPLALGHSDQAVGFGHAAFRGRYADLTAVDLGG